MIFYDGRKFQHHVTGRTILRDLNIPGHMIPEYRLPYSSQDKADLAQIVGYCAAVWAADPAREDDCQ